MRKDLQSGLMAIYSKFGWLLKGSIPGAEIRVNIITSDSTVMTIVTRVRQGFRYSGNKRN